MPYRGELLRNDDLAVAVIDALSLQICVLNRDGVILAVNRAWKDFAESNGGGHLGNPVGINYLGVCQNAGGPASEEVPAFAQGLRAVLRGESEQFEMDYPCHSPAELRWFMVRVTPLRRRSEPAGNANGGSPLIGAVIAHLNITDRKQIELEYARLAATDPLTGLANRRFFEVFAPMELSQFHRFGNPLAVAMIDIDRFKDINDTYGHAAGDEVLRHIAAVGLASFRSCDLFARLGGDEFTCLMPRANIADARRAAERFREALEASPVDIDGRIIPVTASIGVTVACPADHDMDDVLQRADAALYHVKTAGRNHVQTMVPDGTSPMPVAEQPR